MAASVSQHGETYYLSGVAGVPDLGWYRDGDHWASRPEAKPADATIVTLPALPPDLREELLAFVARAEAMGPANWDSGN